MSVTRQALVLVHLFVSNISFSVSDLCGMIEHDDGRVHRGEYILPVQETERKKE